MIRIRIDLLPYGDEERAEHLGEIRIVNDGNGTKEVGNYVFEVKDLDSIGEGLYNVNIIHQGMIKNHKRNKGFWPLLVSIFKAIGDLDSKNDLAK